MDRLIYTYDIYIRTTGELSVIKTQQVWYMHIIMYLALFELLVWPHEVEPWFHSWYKDRVKTLDANI